MRDTVHRHSRPELRRAKFADIANLVSLMEDAVTRSGYGDRTSVDPAAAKVLLQEALKRHGQTQEGSTFLAVVDNGICLEGCIIGMLQRFYVVCDTLEATDLFFYARPGAHPMTAPRLLQAMHKWARSVPGLIEIRQATSDAIVESERAGRLMKRSGMREAGHLYKQEVNP